MRHRSDVNRRPLLLFGGFAPAVSDELAVAVRTDVFAGPLACSLCVAVTNALLAVVAHAVIREPLTARRIGNRRRGEGESESHQAPKNQLSHRATSWLRLGEDLNRNLI